MGRSQYLRTDGTNEADEDRKVPERGTPLTPEVNCVRVTGRKRRSKAGHEEHDSPRMLTTSSRKGVSMFLTRNVPQLKLGEATSVPVHDGAGMSSAQQQDYFVLDDEDDEPKTPRESILKTPKAPPKVKHVCPLDLSGFDVTETPCKSPLSVIHIGLEHGCEEAKTPRRRGDQENDIFREWL